MGAPKAFISYSHDSPQHKTWTKKLATDLRALGVDVILDQWDLHPGQDLSLFMQRGISESDRVVMVCSSVYVKKAEAGSGGVGYERLIVTEELVRSIDTIKFIPIIRGNDAARKIPIFMGPRLYIDFENDAEYSNRLEELARATHGAPAVSKPLLGPNPFTAGPSSAAIAPRSLDDPWFAQGERKANEAINDLHINGYMTLRANIDKEFFRSQNELLDAVTRSEIRTFGWPIGITLQKEEYRPRPYADEIRAEVAIENESRKTYDYWALRSNGDYFLLQSLFEDTRVSDKIFFDTRIVRVTESLMFFESLYAKLGATLEAHVHVRVGHRGLYARELSAASARRLISSKRIMEGEVQSEISTVLGTMKVSRVEDVRKLLSPMFYLFDFQEFHESVYEEIVRNFEQGIIM